MLVGHVQIFLALVVAQRCFEAAPPVLRLDVDDLEADELGDQHRVPGSCEPEQQPSLLFPLLGPLPLT